MFLGEKMKRLFLIFLLLNVALAFAQDDERTPEGYRIIRIKKEYTKDYKDSVAYVEEMKKEPVSFRLSFGAMLASGFKDITGPIDSYYYGDKEERSTIPILQGAPVQLGLVAWIPLLRNNLALRTGLLFESTYLFCRKKLFFEDPGKPKNVRGERGHVVQGRLVFPMLLAVKTRTSSLMFEIGTQFSIPLVDRYESVDLIERDLRSTYDIAVIFGVNGILNRYVSLELLFEKQTNDTYSENFVVGASSLRAFGIKLGVVFTPF